MVKTNLCLIIVVFCFSSIRPIKINVTQNKLNKKKFKRLFICVVKYVGRVMQAMEQKGESFLFLSPLCTSFVNNIYKVRYFSHEYIIKSRTYFWYKKMSHFCINLSTQLSALMSLDDLSTPFAFVKIQWNINDRYLGV